MTRPLAALLARTEWPDPTFGVDAVADWPAGGLDRLVSLGILAPAAHAESVRCDGCDDDHVEAVA